MRLIGPQNAAWPASSAPGRVTGHAGPGSRLRLTGGEAASGAGPRYEVMYFLEAPDETLGAFKSVWAGIGDSIVVVGGEGFGTATSTPTTSGRRSRRHWTWVARATSASPTCSTRSRRSRGCDAAAELDTGSMPSAEEPVPVTSVVAVATGDGIRRIFYSLGVHHIVAGGQSMNPSTEQILEVVESVPGAEVVILPNNKNIVPVAEQGARARASRRSSSRPTASRRASPPCSSTTRESRPRRTPAPCEAAAEPRARRRGDPGGPRERVGGGPDRGRGLDRAFPKRDRVGRGPPFSRRTCGLLDKMLGDGDEIVTLIEGAGATAADTRRVSEWLRESRPAISLELHHGGQPLYPYLVSVE